MTHYSTWVARPRFAVSSAAFLIFCCWSLTGCKNDSDSRQFHLNGTVTINGNPVKHGKISFIPDNQMGNSGAMGLATITDGHYDTHSLGGRGTIGGPHLVQIESFAQVANDNDDVSERALRENLLPQRHLEKLDIPKVKHANRDFVIKTDK